MPARDDSVIRGSLIACVIFLVLSLVLNFLFWRMGDVAAGEAEAAKSNLLSVNATVQKQSDQLAYLKGVIGVGQLTQAQLDNLAQSAEGDPEMEKVVTDVNNALSYFGPEVDPSQRNLTALPEYLAGLIRDRASQYSALSALRETDKTRFEADLKVAQDAQKAAEDLQQKAEADKEALRVAFEEERARMKLEGEQLQDRVNNLANENRQQATESAQRIRQLETEAEELVATIDTQRRQINTMTNPEFQVAQGQVTYTRPGDRLVMINLGSADALRNGVSFGVFDADVSGVTDTEPKAMIEVVAIRGDHLAEARIVGDAFIGDPIIPGDKVYSPFWAPGRRVRIAIAGTVDVNRDGRADEQDTNLMTGMIQSAGAEVAAVVDGSGRGASLDSSIRFLVVGDRPEASETINDPAQAQRDQQMMAEMGATIAEARQLGITIIPFEKLVGFLKTMDDSITVPLGPTARGTDFPPRPVDNVRRIDQDVSELYQEPPQRGGN